MSKYHSIKATNNELEQEKLLALLTESATLKPEELEKLLLAMDNFDVLAKIFILEGVPYVFQSSPMRYLIFREQVAERFEVGYQDVCIVGSAKLGFSPSPHKFGQPFSETSDVDVVVISAGLFDQGTHALFEHLSRLGPKLDRDASKDVLVSGADWRTHKDAARNYKFANFNPGLLPGSHPLRAEIFSKISSTSALFLALEPKVFVSKIRCRIFKNWRAAEAYYTNTLRQLKEVRSGAAQAGIDEFDDEEEQSAPLKASAASKG